VDNIALNGVIIDNGDDVRLFESMQPPVEVDFSVIIYAPEFYNEEFSLPYRLVKLNPIDSSETIEQSLAGFSGYKEVFIIVSSNAGPTNYKFGLLKA